jgi:hypothetical protein
LKAEEPRRVLISAPVAPLNKYTAPASVPPASSKGEVITTFPVLNGTSGCGLCLRQVSKCMKWMAGSS